MDPPATTHRFHATLRGADNHRLHFELAMGGGSNGIPREPRRPFIGIDGIPHLEKTQENRGVPFRRDRCTTAADSSAPEEVMAVCRRALSLSWFIGSGVAVLPTMAVLIACSETVRRRARKATRR